MSDRGSRTYRRPVPAPAGGVLSARWRPLLALLALLVALGSVAGVAPSERVATAGQSLQATPIGTPIAGTPAATPATVTDDRCSVVLGVGGATDACIAFVNAVPGSEPVDVTVVEGGDVNAGALGSGEFADFVAVASETDLTIEVTVGDTLLATETVRLSAGSASVIVFEQPFDQAGPTLVAAPLDLASLSTGQARVVFHHAVTDAADLAVLGLDAPSDATMLPGETTDPVTLDAAPAVVTVVPANAPEQVLATLDLSFEPDLSYVVIIGGTTGDLTVAAIYAAAPVAST